MLHPRGDLVGEVGVVGRLGAVGADVQRLVPERPQLLHQPLLELEPRVIGANGNDFGHRVPNV